MKTANIGLSGVALFERIKNKEVKPCWGRCAIFGASISVALRLLKTKPGLVLLSLFS